MCDPWMTSLFHSRSRVDEGAWAAIGHASSLSSPSTITVLASFGSFSSAKRQKSLLRLCNCKSLLQTILAKQLPWGSCRSPRPGLWRRQRSGTSQNCLAGLIMPYTKTPKALRFATYKYVHQTSKTTRQQSPAPDQALRFCQ